MFESQKERILQNKRKLKFQKQNKENFKVKMCANNLGKQTHLHQLNSSQMLSG